jgi:hypothetical protein
MDEQKPCAFCGVVDGVIAWFEQPFRRDQNAFLWLCSIGLILVAVWFWQSTLLLIHEEI